MLTDWMPHCWPASSVKTGTKVQSGFVQWNVTTTDCLKSSLSSTNKSIGYKEDLHAETSTMNKISFGIRNTQYRFKRMKNSLMVCKMLARNMNGVECM